jgi:Protein of unknown function, DUF400.
MFKYFLRYIGPVFLILLLCIIPVRAAQSTIVEAEGVAAMGNDKSRNQTEDAALLNAKRSAIEYAGTVVQSETTVKNFVLKQDLINAYSQASVKVLEVVEASWAKDPQLGDCYKVKIKAEVIPDQDLLKKTTAVNPGVTDDPTAPLAVKIWTAKPDYKAGDQVKIFIKGNKPFFGRIVYRDAGGNLVQILPNPYRKNNYFNGGVIYELPSGDDRYQLEVGPPFGAESAIIYASTAQLGQINIADIGAGVYAVNNDLNEVATKSRGINIKLKSEDNQTNGPTAAAEFAEAQANLKTTK